VKPDDKLPASEKYRFGTDPFNLIPGPTEWSSPLGRDPPPSENPSLSPSTAVKNPAPYRAPLYEFCLTPYFCRGNGSEKHGNSPGTKPHSPAGIIEVIGSNVLLASGRSIQASAGFGVDPQGETPWRAKFHRRATLRRRGRRMPPKSDGPGGGVPLPLPGSQRILTARKKNGWWVWRWNIHVLL